MALGLAKAGDLLIGNNWYLGGFGGGGGGWLAWENGECQARS
jgi:hypothetical protein